MYPPPYVLITMETEDLFHDPENDQFVAELTPHERDVFADMLMRSLRGSWGNPRPRTRLLDEIASHELDAYDDLQSKVDGYRSDAYSGVAYGDGRYFRHYYEEADVDIASVGEETVREFADRMPQGDLTWDEWRVDKVFEEEDD